MILNRGILVILLFIGFFSTPCCVLKAQDTQDLKHSLEYNFFPQLKNIGSFQKEHKYQISYKYHLNKVRLRSKFSYFEDRNYLFVSYYRINDCQKENITVTEVRNDFQSKEGFGLSLGLDWKYSQKKINFYFGGDLFFERTVGNTRSLSSRCYLASGNENTTLNVLGETKAAYNRLGLIPVLGVEFNATQRLFLLLEFGWRVFTEFGKGLTYDESLSQNRHSIRPDGDKIQINSPQLTDLSIGVRF